MAQTLFGVGTLCPRHFLALMQICKRIMMTCPRVDDDGGEGKPAYAERGSTGYAIEPLVFRAHPEIDAEYGDGRTAHHSCDEEDS